MDDNNENRYDEDFDKDSNIFKAFINGILSNSSYIINEMTDVSKELEDTFVAQDESNDENFPWILDTAKTDNSFYETAFSFSKNPSTDNDFIPVFRTKDRTEALNVHKIILTALKLGVVRKITNCITGEVHYINE